MKKTISQLFSRHYRVIFLLLFFFSIPALTRAVEGLHVDIKYPITSPLELFADIKQWQYEKSSPQIFNPYFSISGKTDVHMRYNTTLLAGFSYRNTQYLVSATDEHLTLFDNMRTKSFQTSFGYNEDSVFVAYKKSSWYGYEKDILSTGAHVVTEGRGYLGEISLRTNRFNTMSDYTISSTYHKFYGYANLLSFELAYAQSPYFIDKEKTSRLNLKDRFAYKDYLFIIPGIQAEFLSQNLFTPFIQTVYLINKNVSISMYITGQAFENSTKKPYELPYLTVSDSLKTPLNLFSATFLLSGMADTSMSLYLQASAKKVKNPIFAFDHNEYFLTYENLDTTIIITQLHVNGAISSSLFSFQPCLTFTNTPFYNDRLPYFPLLQFSLDFKLNPATPLSLINNISFNGISYDGSGRKIEPYYVLSSSLELHVMKHVSLHIGARNINDNQKRFIGNVYFPGRIINTGLEITF